MGFSLAPIDWPPPLAAVVHGGRKRMRMMDSYISASSSSAETGAARITTPSLWTSPPPPKRVRFHSCPSIHKIPTYEEACALLDNKNELKQDNNDKVVDSKTHEPPSSTSSSSSPSGWWWTKDERLDILNTCRSLASEFKTSHPDQVEEYHQMYEACCQSSNNNSLVTTSSSNTTDTNTNNSSCPSLQEASSSDSDSSSDSTCSTRTATLTTTTKNHHSSSLLLPTHVRGLEWSFAPKPKRMQRRRHVQDIVDGQYQLRRMGRDMRERVLRCRAIKSSRPSRLMAQWVAANDEKSVSVDTTMATSSSTAASVVKDDTGTN